MLHDDPIDLRAGEAKPRLSIRVRLARLDGDTAARREEIHAEVRRRLHDVGVAAIGADIARGGIVVPIAREDTRRRVERALAPLAAEGLIEIHVRQRDPS